MKTQIQKMAVTVLTVGAIFLQCMSNAQADEANLKPKSVALAAILGADGIPGDALFYAGKPKQAVGDIALTVAGAGVGFIGLYLLIANSIPCENCLTDRRSSAGRAGGIGLLALGGGAVIGGYFWDLIGGISGVKNYNQTIAQKSSSLFQRVQPTFMATSEGVMGGFQVRF